MKTKRILTLLGKMGSGKSTASQVIRDKLGSTATLAFADPFKELCQYVFAIDPVLLYGASSLRSTQINVDVDKSHKKLCEIGPEWTTKVTGSYRGSSSQTTLLYELLQWCETLPQVVTVRDLLQEIGTIGRSVDLDMWARYTLNKASGFLALTDYDYAVVSDLRRLNEARLVKEYDGLIWYVKRDLRCSGNMSSSSTHESELDIETQEMQSLVDAVIDNSGSEVDLEKRITALTKDLS